MSVSRRTTLKAIAVAGGLGATSGTVFAKGEHEDDERPADDAADEPAAVSAAVRVAHFSPDAPNVDILVDDEQVLADVPYGAVSPYLELEPGTYTVAITAAGDPEAVVFEDEVEVAEGFATIAAIGELEAETFRPEILVDAEPLPEGAGADAAFVRVAHFSPDAPAVDIYADEEPLVEGVEFEDVSEYLAVPAGAYTLSVRPAGEDEEVASFDVELEAESITTGYAIGYLEPPEEFADREFTVELVVDGPAADAEEEAPEADHEDEDPKDEDDEKDVDEKDEKDADEKDDDKDVDEKDEKDEKDVDEKDVDEKDVDEKDVDEKGKDKIGDDAAKEKEPADGKNGVDEKEAANGKDAADGKHAGNGKDKGPTDGKDAANGKKAAPDHQC
ncbi:DUF4397 domain-containing protein [Natronococcus sp. A-GB7]|uniref:DUF4397 domain-containing protein n=1 Tax=Natronococcus sp. A-GB7 TaxID=3037649 RepID=UPI00241FC739|nr:DUF4397 domain-containing protein [Natronococcus sp. A-GB7]MDG5819634.1 DUF4397 domain-containing protein [Natronococcus sp. A-GB7]